MNLKRMTMAAVLMVLYLLAEAKVIPIVHYNFGKSGNVTYAVAPEKLTPLAGKGEFSYFLKEVVPVAEKAGVNLCIHPDDPPFSLLGLPRIVSTVDDFRWILSQSDSVSNGITFCTGSLSTRTDNDLISMAEEFASRIHFVHLRNTIFLSDNSFYESGQLKGNVDMYEVVRILLEEQMRRKKVGRQDIRIPFRPDHGIRILEDYNRTANPGYPLIGRLKGLAEIDGLQMGIEHSIK